MSNDNDNTALVTAVLFSIAVIAAGSLSTGHHPVDVLLIIVGKITWYGFLMVVFGIPALYLGWNILIAAKHYYGDVKRTHKTHDESPISPLTDILSKATEKAKDLLKRTAPPGEDDESQENETAALREGDEYEEITAYEENGEEEYEDDDEDDDEEDEEDEEDDDEDDEDEDVEDAIFRRE